MRTETWTPCDCDKCRSERTSLQRTFPVPTDFAYITENASPDYAAGFRAGWAEALAHEWDEAHTKPIL